MLALALILAAGPPALDGGGKAPLSGTPGPRGVGETEVLSLIQAQAAAWNRGDLEAFCGVYADDAVFVSPTGVTKGRAEVLARYRKRYPDQKAMGQLEGAGKIRTIRRDLARVKTVIRELQSTK